MIEKLIGGFGVAGSSLLLIVAGRSAVVQVGLAAHLWVHHIEGYLKWNL